MENQSPIWFSLAAVVMLALPFVLGDYFLLLANRAIIFSIIALSVALLASELGLVSLVQTTCAGLAGYAFAISVMSHDVPIFWAILIAIVFVQLVAIVFALLTARVVGVPFMMLTLALGQLFWALTFQWSDVTRGTNGFTGIPTPSVFGFGFDSRTTSYYMALIVATLVFWSAGRVTASSFGLLLRGIRDNEPRMKAFGHPVARARFLFFQLTAFYACLGGLLLTWETGLITPPSLDLNRAIWVLTAVVLGGVAMKTGVLVGVVLLVFLEATINIFTSRHLIIFGGILIFSMIAMPDGLVPTIRDALRRQRTKTLQAAKSFGIPHSNTNSQQGENQ